MFKNLKISSRFNLCFSILIFILIITWGLSFFISWSMKQKYSILLGLYEVKEKVLEFKDYEDKLLTQKNVKKELSSKVDNVLAFIKPLAHKDNQMGAIKQVLENQKANLSKPKIFQSTNRKLEDLIEKTKKAYLEDLAQCCRKIRILYFALIFISLVIALFFMRMLAKGIVRPILKCKEFAEKIIKEDFSEELEVNQEDEIGEIADSLRKLATTFQDRVLLSEGVIKNMSLPCSVIDKDLKVRLVNQAMLDFLKDEHPPEYWVDKKVGELTYNDPNRVTITQKCIETGKAQYHIEAELIAKDGEKRPSIVDSSPLFDHDGNIIGAFSTSFDISQIKEQQKKIMEQTERLKKAAEDAEGVVKRLTASTQSISEQLSESARGAESQQRLVSETATAMEEMNSTALEIAKNATDATGSAENSTQKAQDGLELVQKTIHQMSLVNERSQELNKDMEDLGERAENIGDVITTISDIADQTNLLALNAAIEAARAGDAGRGFAVVADEVRKLAEKTMAATKEVSDTIRGIQEKSKQNISKTHEVIETLEESVVMINKAGELIKSIVELATETQQKITNIATAAEEQSSTSEEINRSIQEINQIAAETVESMDKCEESIKELMELANLLEKIIKDLRS